MTTHKNKKVKTWLKSAVERVREFAYTEPPPGEPAKGFGSALRWRRIRERNRASRRLERPGEGKYSSR